MQCPGISEQFLKAAGVEERTEGSEPHLFIPYHDRTGNLTGHYRRRLFNPKPDGQKYDQPVGSAYEAYFCHVPLKKSNFLFLTEGEKKALALAEEGLPVIGLP